MVFQGAYKFGKMKFPEFSRPCKQSFPCIFYCWLKWKWHECHLESFYCSLHCGRQLQSRQKFASDKKWGLIKDGKPWTLKSDGFEPRSFTEVYAYDQANPSSPGAWKLNCVCLTNILHWKIFIKKEYTCIHKTNGTYKQMVHKING